MSLQNIVARKFSLPLSDKVTHWDINNSLNFLLKSQWWSRDQLVDFQNQRLCQLITHAYNHVPYYQRIMKGKGLIPDDFQTVADLNKMPILTKKIVQANFPDGLVAQNVKPKDYMQRHSSGSTGTPVHFYVSKKAYGMNSAANLRGWTWMGYELGDKIIKVSQNKRHSLLKKMQDQINRTLLFTQEYTAQNFELFIKEMWRFQPDFLRSYPDPLQFLTLFAKKYGKKMPPIKGINTTGNILFDEVRKKVEEQFKTKIFDSYSCEGGPNMFECPTHSCYHVAMEYGISEILNKNGDEVVQEGETGRHYVTDLWNFAMPLIRYDSNDILTKGPRECSCGRGLATVKRIDGRNNDIIITPSGNLFVAQSFTTYFKYISSIQHFQVIQNDKTNIIFRFVVNGDYDESIAQKIVADWSQKFGDKTNLEIVLCDDIPLLPSGKRRFLIRNQKIKLEV